MSNSSFDSAGDAEPVAPQFDPMQVLLRHKMLFLFWGLIGVGLGYLHYVRQPRVYESAASVLVVQEKASNLPMKNLESSRTLEDGLSTQMLLIRSPLVINNAAADPAIAQLPTISASGDPAGTILEGLSVGQARAENGNLAKDVLQLSFRGADPAECADVLRIVIAAYQRFLGDTRDSISKETVDLIEKAKNSLDIDLAEKERKFRAFQQDAPLLWSGDQGKNIHQDRLAEIEQARSKVMIDQTQLKAQIESIDQAIARGENREALALMASQLAAIHHREPLISSALNPTLSEQLVTLAIEEQMLLDKVGAQHPKVQQLRKRIEVTRRLVAEASPAADGADKPAEPPDVVSAYLGSLRQELASLNRQQEGLDTLFAAEQTSARKDSLVEIESTALQTDIGRTKQLFDGVIKRLDEISLVKDVGGVYTQIINQPGLGVQVLPRLSTTLAFAVLVGLALGFVCGAVLELTNRDFRSFDEVSQQLKLPIIGHFPQLAVPKTQLSGSRVDSTIFAYHQPKSLISEAYRGIRTSIYFSARDQLQPHQVIQVTSPLLGDGKTVLTANLAVTIAQSGKRVLFIDADFRRPRAAKLFGVKSEAGLVGLLNGELELDDCVHTTEIPNLSLMPVGSRPFNPSELLSSPRFRQLLDVVREKYDFVLVDSPPLLPVTDASIIAAATDGVVLLVRARKDMRSAALASVEKLNAVGAKVLGVAVRGRLDGGNGSNGYGYGYGYRYEASSESDAAIETPQLAAATGRR